MSSSTKAPSFVERYFELQKNGTNVRTEVLAGITTFIAIAYGDAARHTARISPASPVSPV